MKTFIAALLLAVAPVEANRYPSVEKQLQLNQGQTESQVLEILGTPSSVSLYSCEFYTAQCKEYLYRAEAQRAYRVTFSLRGKTWTLYQYGDR